MGSILLVRHGETSWNQDRRIQGWAPSTLTARGREQAQAVGAHIEAHYSPTRIVGSDLRRVQETVREIARTFDRDIPVSYDSRWRERDFGVLQGLTYRGLFEGYPEFSLEALGVHAVIAVPERGESLLSMHERVIEGFTAVMDSTEDDECTLVVAHGGPIRSVLGHIKGWDLIKTMIDQQQSNCSINEVTLTDDGPTIVRENDPVAPITRT